MKGYRTILVNVLAALIPFLALAEWRDVIPDQYWPFYALGLAMANMLLRTITDTPIGRKVRN